MKETNSQKIKRYYNISKINTKYKDIVWQHINKEITDAEFIFECDKLYSDSWRKDFISLEEWKDEKTLSQKMNNNIWIW